MVVNGLSYDKIVSGLGDISGVCDSIKEHTEKKIQYVKKYVENWLYVVTSVSKNIFFIDSMSNAGIYLDGHLCTCMEVLNVFISFAQRHPDIKFYLMCNDKSEQKIEILKKIQQHYRNYLKCWNISNIIISYDNKDVSDYIDLLTDRFKNTYSQSEKRSILLYVDPYNMMPVELIEKMIWFSSNVYCEIIWNYFSSDITRNRKNVSAPNKMKEINRIITRFYGDDYKVYSDVSADQLMEAIVYSFTSTKYLRYKYFMQIQTSKRIPLYNLIYITPSIYGLRKMKKAVWDVFGFHDSYSSSNIDRLQPNLFGETSETDAYDDNRNKVKEYLMSRTNKIISYEDVELFCLEHTIFYDGNIIDNVIKPLINQKIIKQETEGRKYKNINYIIL